MAENRDLLFRFLGDSRDLDRATRGAKRSLDDTERSASRTERGIGKLNTALGGFAAAVSVGAMADFAWDAAQMAASAETAADSAEKVLGPALDGLHTNLEDVRGTLGLNIGELDQIVARFGLLTDGMGLTDQAQADFIEGLIVTGGELAAFTGDVGRAPEAIDALGAALRGEFDPLEQFGVKLNEAAIKERELELRTDPANAALSDQEIRILAIQQLIDEKAGAAIGSLAEAEETLAGKVNDATTKFEDLKIQLGEKLMPVFGEVLEFLLRFFDSWDRLTNPETFENTRLGQFVAKLRRALEKIGGWLDSIKEALEKIRNWDDALGNHLSGANRTAPNVGDAASTYGRRAAGGRVNGPIGAPVPIIAHGGEMISNPRLGQGDTGAGIHITIEAGLGDPHEIARKVVEVLEVYNRTNGPIPITTRSA